jgi:hypothetical protein
VDEPRATPQDLDALAVPDEQAWLSERRSFLSAPAKAGEPDRA